jgi:quercetin dioxygenase-like cupin family protein
MTQTLPPVRRVVSGLDDEGRSCVIFDGPSEPVIWSSDQAPADNRGRADAGGGPFTFEFPVGGTRVVSHSLPPGTNTPMHTTDTLDYLVVVAGQISFITETGEAFLRPGDIVIDRGVSHAWRVEGSEPARMILIMVKAEPLGATTVFGEIKM